VGVSSA